MSSVLREFIIKREHHKYRRDIREICNLSEEYKALGLSPKERMTRRFELVAKHEMPILLPNEKICFL